MKKILTVLLMLPILAFGKTITLNENNTINFNQDFNGAFVAQKQIEAIKLCARNLGSTINVVLYTPGGSISAGQLFFDTLSALPCKFNTITVFAASMGYQTVQNLGARYIINSGTLMSHRASLGGVSGELGGELDQIIKYFKRNVKELETVASARIGMSLKQYREAIRDELWLTAQEAVENNHADKVVKVKCDKTLMGTTFERYDTFFGSFNVEFSNCPIVVGIISVEYVQTKSNTTEEEANGKESNFINYFNNISRRVSVTL